jgi:hypothetical protein
MPVYPSLARWLVLGVALGCISCSGSGSDGLHPVTGKVLHKGQPAKGVVVAFHPKGADPVTAVRPIGVANEAGVFTLTTGTKDGAAPGEYVVTLVWPEDVVPKGKKGFSTAAPESQDRLQGAYANVATSTIKITVKEGPNQLGPFDLT